MRRHRRWRRRNISARKRWQSPRRKHMRQQRTNSAFLDGAGDGRFQLFTISATLLDGFSNDKNRDFIQLYRLLRSFNHADRTKTLQQVVGRFNAIRSSFESSFNAQSPDSFKKMMLVWDTGASFGLTPFRQDFIDYVEVELPVKDTKINKVIGVGTAIFKFRNDKQETIYLPCIAYHLPSADVRLFSPQTYHQMHDGSSTVNADQVVMNLHRQRIVIPVERSGCNLAVIRNASVSKREKEQIGYHFKSRLSLSGLTKLDAFATVPWEPHSSIITSPETTEIEYEHYAQICCPAVGSDENQNLSGPQKELLL
mmetsp:Transcript_18724/g.38474  ORF Transcript_18724/g.38474 Transcript_18724/m.38474 type:complete len:311 (-) Transcript_18724:683-1615(-)